MPIWSEFAKVLKQYEADIRAGKRFPSTTVFTGQPIRIENFSWVPKILMGEMEYFPIVEINSPIGCFLAAEAQGERNLAAAFRELVNRDIARRVFEQYSTMAFLIGGRGTEPILIAPDQAVRYAEFNEPHRGRPTGPRNEPGSKLPPTPAGLRDGVWHHVPTSTEFPIVDRKYHAGGAGEAGATDAPILALGNNLHRVLAISAETDAWYEDYPPPAAPYNPAMNAAYVRSLRSYLKKMAIQLIERDNWFLLWHGYLYTNGRPIDFERVFGNSRVLGMINWPEKVTVTELDANNAAYPLDYFTWGDLKTARNNRTVGRGGAPAQYASFYKHFQNLGNELKRAYPQVFARRPTREDTELTGDLLTALVEGRLDESLTYNQMLTATAQYWQSRLKTVRNVHTTPPGLVMLKDGTVDLSFNFVSRPSTEGRPHVGYVKFVPERGQPKLIDKLKDFLGRIGQQVKKFIGKKVPPQALKGSDLRKMLCEVSCDCKDFKYRMSYANVKAGVTTQAGRTDNGQAPVKTNPARRPGFCKHILATLRYLTDDAEIQISKDLSREQQEALKKDRAQFYREARVAYEKMKAPAAKGAEELKPEEEPPPSPEFAKLPAPPKPELAPMPPLPVTPGKPLTPDYPASQG